MGNTRNLTRRGFVGGGSLGLLALLTACGGAGAETEQTTAKEAEDLLDKLYFEPEEMPDGFKHVIFVEGSWHDMGYQFASQCPDAVKRDCALGIGDAIASYSWEGVKALEPAYLALLEEHAPQLLELYRGMAEAVGVEFEDFVIGFLSFYESPEQAQESLRTADGCSNVAAWGSQTKDGKLIVGADWDANGENAYYMPTVVAYPDEGNAFISESGFQGNLVMNNVGLVCAGSSGQSAADGDMGQGIPVMTSQFLAASTCSSVEEAKEAYLAHYLTTYGDNANYNDVNGGHVVVEATHSHQATREPGDFGEKDYLIATNDFMCDEMLSSLLPEGSGYDDCRPRYWTEEKIITDAKGQATPRTVAEAISCTGYYDGKEWVTDNWSYETGLNSPEAVSPFYQNLMKAIAVPEDNAYYVMNGCSNTNVSMLAHASGNFVQVILAETPLESAQAARSAANDLIYAAGARIDHAGDDEDMTEAIAYLNQAKEAIAEGDNYLTLAGVATDADICRDYIGKGASAFLRAQSKAQTSLDDQFAVLDL